MKATNSDTQGEDVSLPSVASQLHPLFRPLDAQDRQAFSTENPDAARICFVDEAAIVVSEKAISVCLNSGAEFVLALPSFFTVVITANALVPLLLDSRMGVYTLLHSTGFRAINQSDPLSTVHKL